MEMDKEKISKQIQELINTFKENYIKYKQGSEADTETKLVEPLFEILGWNRNDFKKQEKTYRGKKIGRADYTFYLNDKIVFYLEVKKVGVSLDKEADTQVISYALSKRIPFAISTNFEQMRIFCVEQENAIKNVFRVFTKSEAYIENLQDLLFLTKESFEKNLLLRKAEEENRLKKRASIDKVLLEDFMHIRSLIADDIEKSYSGKYEINEKDEIVQRIIDRLIFIRRCEDSGINPDNISLEEIKKLPGNKVYPKLKEIFEKYNKVYNSGLFIPNKDNDCDNIELNGTIIQKLIYYLYDSKDESYTYDFSWIDADVLGQVYEQYLGKILAQTKSGKAKLKDGQAHRKEQGIYYTPTYIVNYIVKNTVGELLKDKKTNINKIKILDPACGSGSFLIKAFDYLNEHLSHDKESVQHKIDSQGDYSIKTEILKNNLYGVDLDNKAVEITKLNLLLKAAEKNRKLPEEVDLHIKYGNSLIDDETVDKNAFKWVGDFKDGSFDVIIGNPPYGAELNETEREFIGKKYLTSKSYKNTAITFIEQSIKLLKSGGYLGLIVPKSLAYSQAWKPCRDFIKNDLVSIVDVSKAFEDVLLEQVIFILRKGNKSKTYIIDNFDNSFNIEKLFVDKTDTLIVHNKKEDLELFKKIVSNPLQMKNISETSRGLPLQKLVTKTKTKYKMFRGANISRYYLTDSTDYLENIDLNNTKIKYLMQPKIISQRIVAHVTKPKDHIIIMSTIDNEGDILNLDTIENTIITNKDYKLKVILALLNSRLISWYAYRYIFAKAIRTMDFDDYYIGKIPLPNKIQKEFESNVITLVDKMLFLNRELNKLSDKNTSETAKLKQEIEKIDKEIDKLIYKLYGITEEEKKIIEDSLN